MSASLVGALAGSGALPFARADFEATIERAGVGVAASLNAFGMAHDDAANAPESPAAIDFSEQSAPMPESARSPRMQPLLDEIKQGFPVSAQPLLLAGVRRAADFQDLAYAKEYLQHMRDIQDRKSTRLN